PPPRCRRARGRATRRQTGAAHSAVRRRRHARRKPCRRVVRIAVAEPRSVHSGQNRTAPTIPRIRAWPPRPIPPSRLLQRETKRWRDLYRGRAAVEREFGRLKHEYGLAPLRVRGLERVALHADLTMLGRLSQALARARAVPLAA